MPRFVVLHHELPPGGERPSHWDLMLESGGVLKTWALSDPPQAAPRQNAQLLADHRLHYLTYEGPVAGGRGQVTRWDGGTYRALCAEAGRWEIVFSGQRLLGPALLVPSPPPPDQWLLAWDNPP